MNFFSAIADTIRQSLTPCILCHSPSREGICDSCHDRYIPKNAIRCQQCGSLLTQGAPSSALICGECLKNPPAFDATIVAADFVPPVDQIVHLLKFQHQLPAAPVMGRLLYQAVLEQSITPDFLVAVPLGNRRLIERGFNQSHEIAKTLGKLMKVSPHRTLLSRARDTQPQSDLALSVRKKNVHQAFAVSAVIQPLIQGKHIAVVDDVMTTGHTLDEIARVLKQAGAGKVTNIVFARTPKNPAGTTHV